MTDNEERYRRALSRINTAAEYLNEALWRLDGLEYTGALREQLAALRDISAGLMLRAYPPAEGKCE